MSANNGITTYKGVLFDLDGTLVDSAPDLVETLWQIMREEGVAPIAYELARPYVSHGSLGLLQIGLGVTAKDSQFLELRKRFLDTYAQIGYSNSRFFDGIDQMLRDIESHNVPWGIVTNKPHRFTEPLIERLNIQNRSAITVSGDTCEKPKPSPIPILSACNALRLPPNQVLYVGDAARDIEAGRAAGNSTISVGFGYIPDEEDALSWCADFHEDSVSDLHSRILQLIT
jgi:N-acetyl-D-muramate 6-phosphate phosphatase